MKIMSKRRFTVLLAVLLVMTAVICGTVAYLVTDTPPLVNTFTPSHVNVEVKDTVDGNVKSNVVIENTGDTNAYIRARIVGSWVSNEDNTTVVQAWDPAPYINGGDGTFVDLPGTGWVESDGYYYYTTAVAPGETTTKPLFDSYTITETVEGAHLVLDILVQAIQSEGGAVNDAWNWVPNKPVS